MTSARPEYEIRDAMRVDFGKGRQLAACLVDDGSARSYFQQALSQRRIASCVAARK